ncbi:M15 family metallopeptidase [Kribbella sp. CA-293567]|uniref:M15 family metallopeptidase n=1 Tax=Kribbella sp. CA-293567 TaxID=3002436 RepID=UPI0022DDDD87|nr:M15 family metallopeptidase [Kribbella sp. CA-293567]WBQ06313.1 M15 family metallopeptidase [Kribbella sp. CA-293567]
MLTDKLVATRKKERRLTALVSLAVVAATICFGLAACSSISGDSASGPSTSGTSASSSGSASSSNRHKGGAPTAEDGVLPDNASPFDTSLPGVSKLNPKLLKAIQDAATAAEKDGIKLHLTTGWRSKEYQQELLKKAIAKYGSREKAAEYVAGPEESHHVTGNAVDVGPTDADDWLNRKGHRFGLCQTLANEIWHFELATTPGGKCPPMQSTSSSR